MSNVADSYAKADDANRRLCNQALFKAIYVDEDNDARPLRPRAHERGHRPKSDLATGAVSVAIVTATSRRSVASRFLAFLLVQ